MEKYKFSQSEGYHGSLDNIIKLVKIAQESGFGVSESSTNTHYWSLNNNFVWGSGLQYFFSCSTSTGQLHSFEEMKKLLTQHMKKEKYIFESEIGVECNTEQEMKYLAQCAVKGGHPVSEQDAAHGWVFRVSGINYFKYGCGLKYLFDSGWRPEKLISMDKMVELLTQHLDVCEREEIIKKKLPIPEAVIIPADLFREGWSQMGRDLQLKYQDKVNAYTGKCKSSDLQELYDEICSSWKRKLEQEFPWLSELKDLSVDVRMHVENDTAYAPKNDSFNAFNYLIAEEKMDGTSFFLNPSYNWKLEKTILTPEKKK